MKKIILGLILALLCSGIAHAEIKTLLYESISVGTSSAKTGTSTLSASVYDSYRSIKALYTIELNNVRYRTDGTAPTTTEGHLLYVGDVLTVTGISDIRNFQAIGTVGTATIKVSYSGESQ